MSAFLDALNASGTGKFISSFSGNPNTAYETSNQPVVKPTFATNVGNTIGAIGSAVGGAITGGINDAVHLYQGTARNLGLDNRQAALSSQVNNVQARDTQNTADYKAGKISKQQYSNNLKGLINDYQGASSTAQGIQKDHYTAPQVANDYAGAAGTALALAAPVAEAGAGVYAGVKGATAAAKVLDAGLGAGKSLGANLPITAKVPTAIAGKVVRGGLVGTPTAQTAVAVPSDIAQGNYVGAAGNAAILAAPAIAKGVTSLASKLAPNLAAAMYGKQGFFDALKAAGGPDMIAHLDSLPQSQHAALGDTLRQIQQYNMDQFHGDTHSAATFFKNWVMDRHGGDISQLTPQQLASDLTSFASSHAQAAALHDAGRLGINGAPLKLKDGQSVVVGRFAQNEKTNVMNAFTGSKTASDRTAALDAMAKSGAMWSKNPYTKSLLYDAAKSDSWAQKVNSIQATHPLQIIGKDSPPLSEAMKASGAFKDPISSKFSNGYFPTITNNGRAVMKQASDTGALDRSIAPGKVLGKIGATLTKAGLSTQATDSTQVKQLIQNNFAKNLEAKGIQGDSKAIYSALAAVDKPGVGDARFLRTREVRGALIPLTDGNPKVVLQALKDAHAQIPKSLIGAGPAVLNRAIAKGNVLPGYIRAETAGRYDSGLLSLPFRAKTFIKGNYVSYAEGRNFGTNITADDKLAMEQAGMLFKGHSGQDQGLGISSHGAQGTQLLSREQEKMVTGLAASIADAHGTTVRKIIEENGPLAKQLSDSTSLIHGYGNGGYLNSPMAKTLNLILFPSRFDAKVIKETGRLFARMPAMQQVATVKGVANTYAFLASPQGQQWQKDNSELVGLIKAFTPLGTVQNLINFTTKGGHFGDLGQIGGLPIGVISTLLTHQGANLGPLGTSQYVDPKTGQPVPTAIPQTVKARMQQGVTDLVASLFSYPGRTAGLGSKTKVIQTAIPQLKPAPGEVQSQLSDGTVVPSVKPTSKTTTSSSPIPTQQPYKSFSAPKPVFKIAAPKAKRVKIYARRPPA